MSISNELVDLQLISGDKICKIFDDIYQDILILEYQSESNFIKELWERYKKLESTNSLNGSVFEGLLATVFYRSGISPIYVQATISFVPNVDFDFIAYSNEFGPISLSAKTSLRERYKQADLEGMILRQVHREARSFLITLDADTARTVNEKISKGQVLGLEEVVVATDKKFDTLISELKKLSFIKPEKIDVVTSKRLISE